MISELGTVIIGKGMDIGANQITMNNQKKLMNQQKNNQMELNRQAKDLALQQWKDTNYTAQVGEIEKAGLNAGLLYGGSGAGGATTNTGSGGGASGGNAPTTQGMDIRAIADLALLKAQKENIEADTENKKAETPNTEAKTAGQLTQNEINSMSKDDQIEYYKAKATGEIARSEGDIINTEVNKNTQQEQINKVKYETEIAKEMQGMPEKQKEEITARIVNMAELARQGREKINIEKFAKELQAEYPSLGAVMGKGTNEITMWLQKQLAKVVGEENASNYRKIN